jgi:preprotein translocase subunit SecG
VLLFAVFAGLAQDSPFGSPERASNNAMAVFSFFLAVLYAVFSVFLFLFRNYIYEGG